MWLLRLLAVILLIGIGVCFFTYVFTGQRAYLALAWRLLRYGVIFALIFFALLIIERVALVPL